MTLRTLKIYTSMSRYLQAGRSGSSVISRWLSSSEVSAIWCIHCLHTLLYVHTRVDLASIWELKVNLASLQDRTNHSVDPEGITTVSASEFGAHDGFTELKDFLSIADQDFQEDTKGSSDSRCLHEMLEESQSDSPVSFYSHLDSFSVDELYFTFSSTTFISSTVLHHSSLWIIVTKVEHLNDWRYMLWSGL